MIDDCTDMLLKQGLGFTIIEGVRQSSSGHCGIAHTFRCGI